MEFTTKGYKAKSSAIRNAKAQLKKAGITGRDAEIEIGGGEIGGFYWGNPIKFTLPKDDGLLHVSAMQGACSLVWTIAEKMLTADPSVKRKAILDACTEQGIAFYTARTQYQRYKEALRDQTAVAIH